MTLPQTTTRRAPAESRRPRRRWLAGLLLLLFAGALAVATYQIGRQTAPIPLWDRLWLRGLTEQPLDSSLPGQGFWITGYYVDYDRSSLQMVKNQVGRMDQVVIFGYGFDRQGNLEGKDQAPVKGLTGAPKRVLLFGNLTGGAFDKVTAHNILTNPEIQDRAVKGIIEKSLALGVAGVQIDFEDIMESDRDAYTNFLRRLRDELHPRGMTLSIAAAAKTRDTRTGWGGATDYPAVGEIVDYFYIMAYDEHWMGGDVGPVASLPWVERVVRYAIGVMPSQKIVLGVPFYGYDWPAAGKNGRAYGADRMAERMAQLGAQVVWDPVVGENKATYHSDGVQRVAWYPDQRSLEAKLRLAHQYNLKGIAIWRLGFEPESWWDRLGEFRQRPEK